MSKTKEIELRLSVDEVNTILEAMGQLPFVRVFTIIDKIQQQAASQIHADNPNEADKKTTSPKTT